LMGKDGKRIIDYPLRLIRPNVSRIFISTSYCSNLFDAYFNNHNVEILNDRFLLNIGGSFLQHMSRFTKEGSLGDQLIMIPGDHVIQGVNIQDMLTQHMEKKSTISIGLVAERCYGDYFKLNQSGQVVDNTNQGGFSSTGVYIVNSSFLIDRLRDLIKRGWDNTQCDFTREIVFPEIKNGGVYGYRFKNKSYWDDAGTIGRYYENNMRLSLGENVIAASARVGEGVVMRRSIILDSAQIEGGFKIDNSIIPPYTKVRKKSDFITVKQRYA
ncbi:hypothetical protein KKC08_00565, partial [Patescibacteria group bacterium]|nr:hypothetical protein [Patescibacteria group bacterium]